MNVQPELSEIATLAADELGLEKLVEFCGKGAFKETYRARDKHGTAIALKLVDRTKIDLVRTEREIEALARCNSPRIAKLIGTHIEILNLPTSCSAKDPQILLSGGRA